MDRRIRACVGQAHGIPPRAIDASGSPAATTPDGAFERWQRSCGDVVSWLRAGTDVFVETFDQIAIGRQRDATNALALANGQQVDRWLFDPRLAPTAAVV